MDTSGDGGVPEVTEPVTDGHGTTVDLPMRMLHELESLQDILSIHTCVSTSRKRWSLRC